MSVQVEASVAPTTRAKGTRSVVSRIGGTVAGSVGTVVVASFVIFVALSFAPGDPVAAILGAKATPQARAAMREKLGLDDPLLVRYWHWLGDAVHGDFGTSLTKRQAVTSLLGPRIETTLLLVVLAAILLLVIGIGLGVLGGVSRRWRPIVSALAGLGIAIPTFVAASVLIGVFAVELGWFPTYGAGSGLADRIHHLILPAIALSLVSAAYVTQLTSAAVREEQGKEHVATSVGRGIPWRVIVRRHVLRNAALPVMTASGLAIAGLVAGSVIVEEAFGIDGIGSLLVTSISGKDYPTVQAISLIIVVVFVVVMTVIDIAQAMLDPRLRESDR
ncbi:MAG: ABC transporter permease [Nocardioides sp.]|uniref:ABC transporter permease n=1 Tax=Nocardioides sp. TaxID=35761 RepID=UPI0039E58498